MHPHTIDWYLQLQITLDTALAEKRWAAAEAQLKTLSRSRIVELLRLFLWASSNAEFQQKYTAELVVLDPEFPVSKNLSELRMMAGLVMTNTFSKHSLAADAFALGLRAASVPQGRSESIQPEIAREAESYLSQESGRLRPQDFAPESLPDTTKSLIAKNKALTDADPAGQPAALKSFRESIPTAISSTYKELGKRINQLAEESNLLWWTLGQFSDALTKPIDQLDPESYALAAGWEAAQRTTLLPPPPSVGPLLARVLKECKPSVKKFIFADYIKSSDTVWRSQYVKGTAIAECRDLVPVSAALEKTEELGSASSALKSLPKLCPGVKPEVALSPMQAALQLYNEMIFMRALKAIDA